MTSEKRNSTDLYFIALIPGEKLQKEVRALKEEMKTNYNAKHALKSPAHITLQMPFKATWEDSGRINMALQRFASVNNPVSVSLSGFKSFAPRIIYIKVINPDPIIRLHDDLKSRLIGETNLSHNEVMASVNPHMTIATRDLSKDSFTKAWEEFENREFHATFNAESLYLLKHNGKIWNIYQEFEFA